MTRRALIRDTCTYQTIATDPINDQTFTDTCSARASFTVGPDHRRVCLRHVGHTVEAVIYGGQSTVVDVQPDNERSGVTFRDAK
ncbi:MAG: hypothetical protein ACRDU4_01180 [Mycobacterium sp.]